MTHRYYLEPTEGVESLAVGDMVKVTDAEAHHFLHVMRGKVNDPLELFDGNGNQFQALARNMNRREVEVEVTAIDSTSRELPLPLTLAVSLPKGDRARWLVEKLTELGATSLTPLIAERAIAQPSGNALEKLRRYSVEACKQSGRNRLLEITEPCSLEAFHSQVMEQHSPTEPLRLVAHPYGAACSVPELISAAIIRKAPVAVVVGPEGGLADAEVTQLHSLGWQPVALGSRILRIETAALALAAMVSLQAEQVIGEAGGEPL